MMLVSSPSLKNVVGDWVSKRTTNTGELGFAGNFNAIAVVHNDTLLAGFVYHDWNPQFQTIHMTLAADTPRWASRRVIEGLLRYPFVELDVQRITVTINENNSASLRLAEGIGFKREAVIERGAGKFSNIIVLRLFIEEWHSSRFYRVTHHEQTISSYAA